MGPTATATENRLENRSTREHGVETGSAKSERGNEFHCQSADYRFTMLEHKKSHTDNEEACLVCRVPVVYERIKPTNSKQRQRCVVSCRVGD